MSDAVEKAMEDRETAISSAFRRGEVKNEIQWIRTLQQMLGWPSGDEQESLQMTLEHLQARSRFLLESIRGRLAPDPSANAPRLRAARDRLWDLNSLHRS